MKTLLTLALCPLAAASLARSTAQFIPFGDLPGGIVQSQALAVSADGTVVAGWSSATSDVAARRALPGAIAAISPPPAQVVATSAFGVAADGASVAGQALVAGAVRAFHWTQAGGAVDIGTLAGGTGASVAFAIAGDGRWVAGHSRSQNTTVPGTNEAFKWTPGGIPEPLGDLPLGAFNSRALAVSFDGRVIAGMATSAQGQEAARWHFRDGLTGLGNFPSPLFNSQARAISDDGSVIAGFGHDTMGRVAFRWTAETGLVSLGELPGGLYDSYANGVSGDGSVVVGRSMIAGSDAAFIWTAATGMRELRRWITESFGLNPVGWNLREAFAISADGSTIVGSGTNPQGRTEGWIVQLPNASIEGQIAVPGFGGDLSTLRTTVELRSPGGATVLSRRMVRPGPLGAWRLTTTVTGTVDVYLRAGSSLYHAVRDVTITSAGVTGLSHSLPLGDIVPDNQVDLQDFLALAASYEVPATEPAFNPDADLDGDGQVALDDFLILAAQYGRRGD